MSTAFKKLAEVCYLNWLGPDCASKESALNNNSLDEYKKSISDSVGEEVFSDSIEWMVYDAADTAQSTGFEAGMRYGIRLAHCVDSVLNV